MKRFSLSMCLIRGKSKPPNRDQNVLGYVIKLVCTPMKEHRETVEGNPNNTLPRISQGHHRSHQFIKGLSTPAQRSTGIQDEDSDKGTLCPGPC